MAYKSQSLVDKVRSFIGGIPQSLGQIGSSMQQPISPVPQYNTQPTYNKTLYNVNKAIMTPLAKAQSFIESSRPTTIVPTFQAPKTQYPGLNMAGQIGTAGLNLAGGVVNSVVGRGIIDPALDAGRLMGHSIKGDYMPSYGTLKSSQARLGYNLAGKNNTAQQVIGNIAGSAMPPLDAYGGGKVFGLGKEAIEQAGKQTFKQVVKNGMIQGAKYGGVGGTLQGLSDARDAKTMLQQLAKGIESGATGAVVGAGVGGAMSGTGYVVGQQFGRLINAYKDKNPKATQQEATQAVKKFVRDELGRFANSKKNSGNKEGGNEPPFYGDFRESIGLPRNGDYRGGFIKPDEVVGGGKPEINKKLPGIMYTTSKKKAGIPFNIVDEATDTQNGRTAGTSQDGTYNTRPLESLLGPKGQQENYQGNASGTSIPPTPPTSGINKIGTPPEPQGNGIIDQTKAYINKLYTEGIDRFHPLSQIAKQAGESQKMQNALTQHYGSGSTGTYHVDYELAPILKGVNTNDLRDAAIAMRDVELANRGIKGSDATEAQQVLENLKNRVGEGQMKVLGQKLNQLYDYQGNLVKKYLVDTGVISKEAYDAMREKNQFYVPFKRVMDQVDDFLGMTPQKTGVGSVGSQNVIKGIKGSDRQIIDPLQSIVENTYKIVSLGRRNQVANTIVNLGDKIPGLIQKYDGDVGNKPVISVLRNGQKENYLVPPDVAEAAKGLNEESLNAIIKILAIPTKVLRATATGLNPEFALPNAVRDLQSAFVNTGMSPLRFVSGLAHLIKKDQVYKDFLKEGGQTSSIALDRKFLTQKVDDLAGNNKLGIIPRKPSDILNILQSIGEYSEQPTRIGMFEGRRNELLKKGLSPKEAGVQAAYAAQEGTVNFARRGSKTQAANALIAFLNARMQGLDRLARTAKTNPVGFAARMALVTQAPAVLSYLWNRNFNSYNDDRVVSPYDKQSNFILMLSDSPIPSLGGAQYIKIPKGDIGKFANPTESFLSYLDGKGDNKAVEQIASAFGSLLPAQNVGDIIPSAIRPPIEYGSNYSFFTGQPIVPEYKQSLPAKYQSTTKTAPQYKLLGKTINQSPAKLENLASGYLTGYEKLTSPIVEKAATMIDSSVARPQAPQGQDVNRIPIMRRFLGGEKRTSDEQQIMNDKKVKSIDFQINDVKGAIKRGDVPMDEGVQIIDKLKQNQLDLVNPTTQSKVKLVNGPTTQANVDNSQLNRYIRLNELDKYFTNTPTDPLKKITFESKKLSKAREIYNDDGSKYPDAIKEALIKKMGYNDDQIRYDVASGLSTAERASYIVDRMKGMTKEQQAQFLEDTRTKSLSGDIMGTKAVYDLLIENGYMDEATKNYLLSFEKDQTTKTKKSTAKAKKPKKISMPKIRAYKAPKITIKMKAPTMPKSRKTKLTLKKNKRTIRIKV